ncbi:MAG: sigma-54 dependent transcriptional regulator [Desulfobulbaceae bacterium]|nr:sigma-54 dependent transcriptional regulator [Desulfobulbaceae bacterium]HIJ78989.1 sigma-54-dependent Fis family transcriptional regulator [Deltaproteobacteria bacterium]
MQSKILLIDDDDSLRRVTEHNLTTAGFRVLPAASGGQGLALFKKENPDLVITDVQLGDMNGLQILAAVKKISPPTPVIVITAFGSIELAVKAMQEGAYTFLAKPFDREALRISCKKALAERALREQKEHLAGEVDRLTGVEGMTTANSAMAELLDTALRVAGSEATVLITGESGTGKEVLARLIHQRSQRAGGPMVTVNCAAIPETLIESELFGHVKGAFTGATANRKGRFQSAAGGTLFLDEVTELRLDLQAKLLRAIQEREVQPVGADRQEEIDVRLIAAGNRDIKKAVSKGEFREDLYYRLGVIPLHIPPLRERPEDIPTLADHFLNKLNGPAEVRFSEAALNLLKSYSWPGNIRELRNIVERSLILRRGATIEAEELQLGGKPPQLAFDSANLPDIPAEGLSLERVEKGLIVKALALANGNRSEAARLLKIPRHVLIYRLEKFGITA